MGNLAQSGSRRRLELSEDDLDERGWYADPRGVQEMILHDDERDFDRMRRDWQLRWGHQPAGGVPAERLALQINWKLVDDGSVVRLCAVWSPHGCIEVAGRLAVDAGAYDRAGSWPLSTG
jgi:hypothetical protein